jgi:stage II sporulation protein D
MPPSFNLEALKAQAVAARTYAWHNRDKHGKQGWDLCDSTDCQAYLGAAGEKPSTSEAIKQTEGLVLVHNGALISAQYCSDCGGATKNGNEPYLRSVADRADANSADFCEHNGHSWTKSWSVEEFESILKKAYPELRGIESISGDNMDATGRVNDVKIDAKAGSICMNSVKLRRMLGLTTIKSTVFTVSIEDGNVIFNGKGFGHGVGLCQYGANGLAAAPNNFTYDRILKHYYQDVDIVQLDSLR